MINLPISLTLYRFLASLGIVLAVVLLERGPANLVALLLFVSGGVTDYLDGYLARKYRQTSALGRMLDPIADKVLVITALLVLASENSYGPLFLIPAAAIVLREFTVSGIREFLGPSGLQLAVTPLAKWKTAVQMVALAGLFLFNGLHATALSPGWPVAAGGMDPGSLASLGLLWLAALLTLMTGIQYLQGGIRSLTEPADDD